MLVARAFDADAPVVYPACREVIAWLDMVREGLLGVGGLYNNPNSQVTDPLHPPNGLVPSSAV